MINHINPDFYLRLLVIDDEQDYLDSFRRIIEDNGHVMVGTTKPEEAASLVKQSFKDMNPFDAVFIDFLMPGLNGIMVAEEIQKIDPDLVRIAITRDRTIKTKTQIIDSLTFRLFVPKGEDLDSYKILFNLLINTKIKQYSGVESRLARVLERDKQAKKESRKKKATAKKTTRKKTATKKKEVPKVTAKKTVKKKTSRKGSRKKTATKAP